MASMAIVARQSLSGMQYLAHVGEGLVWAAVEHDADRFRNIHEATRAAMRLPSKLRAFALPDVSAAPSPQT
jgi:hypothetical protein